MTLNGSVAIVVGASGGIGSATVREFVRQGATPVLAALDDDALWALRNALKAEGITPLIVPTDITQRVDIDRLIAQTLVTYGRVDVLANVAGIGSSPSLSDTTDAEIERVLAVNLLGAARLMHAVLPIMRAQRSGSIVNVGSVAGEVAVMGVYSASKFGLRGLTDSVRREVRSEGIRVTLVEPGFVRTTMNEAMQNLPDPSIVAEAIVAAVARPRRKHIVPGAYRAPILATQLLPRLTDFVFANARIQRRINRDARAARAAERDAPR